MKRKTHFLFKTYTTPSDIYGDGANSVMFINEGTGTVTLNGTIALASNTTLSLNGNIGDEDHTQYSAAFGAGTRILHVIKKMDSQL